MDKNEIIRILKEHEIMLIDDKNIESYTYDELHKFISNSEINYKCKLNKYYRKSLTDELRTAGVGLNDTMAYPELYIEYPHWASDLHQHGNVLPNDTLFLIFKLGLLAWYVKRFINFN